MSTKYNFTTNNIKYRVVISGNRIKIGYNNSMMLLDCPEAYTYFYGQETNDMYFPTKFLKNNYNYTPNAKVIKIYDIHDGHAGKTFYIFNDGSAIYVSLGSGVPYTCAEFGNFRKYVPSRDPTRSYVPPEEIW